MKKKMWIISIPIVLVAAAIGGLAVFHENHVILDGDVIDYQSNAVFKEFPRRDESRIWLNDKLNSFAIYELNRCTALEDLMIKSADDETLEKLRGFEYLKTLQFTYPDEPISTAAFGFINRQPALEDLFLFGAEVDFSAVHHVSLRKITVLGCTVTRLEGLAECSALEELCISSSIIDDHLRRADETVPSQNSSRTDANGEVYEISHVDTRYYLDDSSDLAALDQVKTLSLSNVIIHDVSGLLDMEDLETLQLYDCEISDEDQEKLQGKGIRIVIGEDIEN